jgi:2-keto-4-pentenoate hydratase/2-oxohepta-3-ene-1,7-dioic acid hydratase in catechol pathway
MSIDLSSNPKGCCAKFSQLCGFSYRQPQGLGNPMRLYTFQTGTQTRIGVERDGALLPLPFASMIAFIEAGATGRAIARAALKNPRTKSHPLRTAKLLAPIPRPGKILCSGLNYKSHVRENPGAKFLDDPRFFAKVPSAVIGPGAAIQHPGERFQVDWEVELAVVFGKRTRRATQTNAMRAVFGYTILHDVSSRYIQFKDANETMGKNFDTFCPIGPCIVTKDEIPHPENLRLTLKVNGQTKIDGHNSDWCFSMPRMIEWLSMAMTLDPGDIMTMGCPAGVGYFANPQAFLKPGDVCELEIGGIGTLTNRVVRGN